MAGVETEINQINERYRAGFAGRSRATRDLSALKQIIADMERAASQASGADRERADTFLNVYRSEQAQIGEVQNSGPDVLNAWRLVELSDVTFLRYARAFAGQNRTTRDVWLLREMAAEQRKRIDSWPAGADVHARLPDAKKTLESNLELYEKEIAEIPAARARMSAQAAAQNWATLANGQFALYRVHFSGKARDSRRINLLRRIIDALTEIKAGMEAARAQGFNAASNNENITKVADRLDHHRKELVEIERARTRIAPLALTGKFGDEANAIFKEWREGYQGRNRKDVKLDRLGEMVDVLHEVAQAMEDLGRIYVDDTNRRNHGIVLDAIKRYETEYTEVQKAQKK